MDTEVEFTTLENVLYVEGKNDLGFSIAGKYVVLTEHQSTINHNMPVRFLEYVRVNRNDGYALETAIDMAVNRCINEDILKDFLIRYVKEVRGMLYEDITMERFAQIRGEEQWEEGHSAGLLEGRAEGEEIGMKRGEASM